MLIAALVVLLVMNILVGVLKKRSMEPGNEGRPPVALTVIIGLLDALAIGIAVLLICMFQVHWYYIILTILAGLLLLILLINLMRMRWNTKRLIIWFACVLLIAGGFWGSYRYDRYVERITFKESFDYHTYAPFYKDSLVVRMDEEPTLKFTEMESVPRMDGATALYPVYAAFAEATYPDAMNDMPMYEVIKTVACTTTGNAYKAIIEGECDIIFVAGPSKEQEAAAAEKGVQLLYTPIGREAFVFFVHPSNPITGLTVDQVRSIYAGETTRWDQLGVKGLGTIRAFQRSEGSGSQTALERFVMKDTPLMTPEKENVLSAMGGIVEQVSAYKNHRNAIGYSFRFYCTTLMKNFDVKLLEMNGVAPTVENIENGTYPLASSFYAVTRSDASENTWALVEWICGPQGQALVEKCGYTPFSVVE